MKIIFDSEEELLDFISYNCPSLVKNDAPDLSECDVDNCSECWNKSGIKLEVNDNGEC